MITRQLLVTLSLSSLILASMEQISDHNSSLIEMSNDNSSISSLTIDEESALSIPEAVFDNNYSEEIANGSDTTPQKFHSGPQYETISSFPDKETVRLNFSLFSLANFSDESKSIVAESFNRMNVYPSMVSIPVRANHSIDILKYYRFTIRQFKTKLEKILNMEQLFVKRTTQRNFDHFANSLLLKRLNPKEKYSVCIYYYRDNVSTEMPDLFICQEIMHDHLKHSVHGLLFILTQYSVIIGILVVLQGLFSMRKRRLAHIVHQHLINKSQRLRSTLSSISLVRQSFSSMDGPTSLYQHTNHDEDKFKKRIISSPAIVLTQPSTPSCHSSDENEPFLRLAPAKNHVHFLLGLDENDDTESDCIDNQQIPTMNVDETYGDHCDALLSMAHILDTNKPWSRQSHSTLPV
ncbi:unnamed protein product [Adineta ricciae]|uniref:Uncharacterized protein n=1 Tax=Adineta ricciae TaxID=249248 RepID=A0A815YD38_ADIRI|nr:unnamed protein product [Adineta ricciae]